MKLTEEEARVLIDLLKRVANNQVKLPACGEKKEYKCSSISTKDEFVITTFRGKKNVKKCTFQARIKGKDSILLRLDYNPTGGHTNADGEILIGTHLHLVVDGKEENYAIPFSPQSDDLTDMCLDFLKRFNVLDVQVVNPELIMKFS